MAHEDKKVVWILGAGFSVPLGGPLFRSLISGETLRELGSWDGFTKQMAVVQLTNQQGGLVTYDVEARAFAELICGLYLSGASSDAGVPALWGDAEQFLDRLEIAHSDPGGMLATHTQARFGHAVRRLSKTEDFDRARQAFQAHGALDQIRREAIRYVAGASTAFLLRADDNPRVVDLSEQWDPYRRWFDSLQPGRDSVITFNYDRALDLLGEYGGRRPHRHDLFLSPVGIDSEFFDEQSRTCVPVYHLHGHVGWRTDLTGEKLVLAPPDRSGRTNLPIAHEHPEFAVIGIPGQSKLTLPDTLLKDVWTRAMAAISSATSVVFVGYRFPETDNMAKRCLLDALRKNTDANVHIVLGSANPDTPRLKGMIEWTRDPEVNPVWVQPMLAQDFFAVFDRDGL